MFTKLKLNNWRQFESVEIDFHERLTVLTGANGSGKTTVLKLLSKHFGWQDRFVSTATKDKKSGVVQFWNGFWASLFASTQVNEDEIGELGYTSGSVTKLYAPRSVGNQFDINIRSQEQINGVFLPSHRSVFFYQRVDDIRTVPLNRDEIFNTYSGEVRNRYYGNHSNRSLSYFLKQHLISLATFGEGNKYVAGNDKAKQLFEGFQEILKIILPPQLGFERLGIEIPEVNLVTKSGTFSIDAASGGVAAIIDIAWQIYMHADPTESFVVTIDEPENHLHPEMQRFLLSSLLEAFPKAQFVISTHSPLIISSVEDSKVYVFDYNESNRVKSTFLDFVNKAGTSNQVLRDALGISTSMPIWVESKVKNISEKYKTLNESNYAQFRQEMKEIGLADLIPETLAKIVEGQEND